ncbi:MAG TPA: hypothetical protein VFT84_00750, partial [Gemmatimonadales bacterium]|nr:hypothetical protein [Gemmatimonadales bacterium]
MTAAAGGLDRVELTHLLEGRHSDPHRILGVHPENGGVMVRAMHPDAAWAECLVGDAPAVRMAPATAGIFEAHLPGRTLPLRYRLRFGFAGGDVWELDDPYRFLPSLGEMDVYLISEGTH